MMAGGRERLHPLQGPRTWPRLAQVIQGLAAALCSLPTKIKNDRTPFANLFLWHPENHLDPICTRNRGQKSGPNQVRAEGFRRGRVQWVRLGGAPVAPPERTQGLKREAQSRRKRNLRLFDPRTPPRECSREYKKECSHQN